MKRSLYIILIILVLCIIALGAYLFFSHPAQQTDTTGQNATSTSAGTPGGLPVGEVRLPIAPAENTPGTSGVQNQTQTGAPALPLASGLQAVADSQVFEFFAGANNLLVAVEPDGKIIKIQNGNAETLSSSQVPRLINAQFSYDGKKILVLMGDPLNPDASVFDVTRASWLPLPLGIKTASWSPQTYQIAALSEKNGVRAISILDASKANPTLQEILKIQVQDVGLRWLDQNRIIVSDKGSAFSLGSAWSLNIKTKTLAPLVLNNPGLDSIWSPANLGLVFSSKGRAQGGTLVLADGAGNLLHTLSFLTLPSKCVFGTPSPAQATSSRTGTPSAPLKPTLYCAIPRGSLESATLPDSYFKKKFFTADEIYSIDIRSGATEPVFADANQSFDAIDLKISGGSLYFINRRDLKLYKVESGM